ncbi:histidinol-phosphate transaminase [Massilibacteroides sp.]|uniref:histidinol-phosphate transaminase n=1 Tax=Massilibacteroides sp. TaxID=2034766 RepID=UPI002632429F|nr:histidinol-phosphate transaminase [Massilibacteroides sp.]MDD4514252.1 histidinol-phosphate transaminase [Massilibacteroides sp.]
MKELNQLIRDNVRKMKPYSSARDEFHGEASVYLDANENPFNSPYNRYPDPLQWKVKEKIAKLKGVRKESILLGNGSDEPIDLLIRAFCEPGKDAITSITPSYGMYEVSAEVNNVEFRKVPLTADFELNASELLRTAGTDSKLIYLCSPNNPTGNNLSRREIYNVLNTFDGLVVVDEAYIDFSSEPSFLTELDKHPTLVVLQTFSKAWGAAAVRLGMAFASPEIIGVLNKIKYPYNINQLTQEYALKLFAEEAKMKEQLVCILKGRTDLERGLRELPCVKKIYPSDANFVLVRVSDANGIYNRLVDKGIIVRNRTNVTLCEGCLRITVGTEDENKQLLNELQMIEL